LWRGGAWGNGMAHRGEGQIWVLIVIGGGRMGKA